MAIHKKRNKEWKKKQYCDTDSKDFVQRYDHPKELRDV
jgi:hypothetical protein